MVEEHELDSPEEWLFELEDEEALAEFQEIPAPVRARIEEEVREECMEILHREAVEEGFLPPPPETLYDKGPGRLARLALTVGIGGVVGLIATVSVLLVIRNFATIL